MNKKHGLVGVLVMLLAFASCKKDELELEWNNIVINSVNTSYVQANDCNTPGGSVATNITFSVDFTNSENESIKELELDILYADGDGYYSYNYPNFNVNQNLLTTEVCRPFYGEDYFDIRVFIVTDDDLRSKPKTYRLYKPE